MAVPYHLIDDLLVIGLKIGLVLLADCTGVTAVSAHLEEVRLRIEAAVGLGLHIAGGIMRLLAEL